MTLKRTFAALVAAAGITAGGFAAAQSESGAVPIEDLALVDEHAAFADCKEGASSQKECPICQETEAGADESEADGATESASAYRGHYHHHHHHYDPHHHHYDPHHHHYNPHHHHHHGKDATGSGDTYPSPQLELKEKN